MKGNMYLVKEKNLEKQSYSMAKSTDKETFTLTKSNDKEDITKSIEKITNGWLLTVDIYDIEKGSYKCMKKYFEENPLMSEESEDEGENKEEYKKESSKKSKSDFDENWDILELS